MNSTEALAHWQQLVGDESDVPWTEHHLRFYLHRFRPHGENLEAVFDGLPHGEAVGKRVREVFDAAAESANWHHKDKQFRVRNPNALTRADATRCATVFTRGLAAMGSLVEEEEIAELAWANPRVDVVYNPEFDAEDFDMATEETLGAFQILVDKTVNAFMHALTPSDTPVLMLHDAVYNLTGLRNIHFYVIWPMYSEDSEIEDPFLPAFELWTAGARLYYPDADHVQVHVPVLSD